MYKNVIYTILRNEPLTDAVWRLVLEGDTQWITRPGQFVDIALEGRFLRRPISVCDADERTVTLIYKVVGEGTRQMAAMQPGERLDLLTGLGNGFDTAKAAAHTLLVGGGVGVPPLYGLAKALLAASRRVTVVLGFNTAAEIFYADEFERLGCTTVVATADGSRGVKGFVTTAIAERVPTSATSTPAGRCRCCGRCAIRWSRRGSSRSRSAWAAASVPAWAARAGRSRERNASARRAPSSKRAK